MSAPAEKTWCAVAIALFLGVVVVSYYRATLGVDFTDESFYVAMANRMALGATPFVDEIAVHQTAATLTMPFVGVYQFFLGSADGLMLALRLAFASVTVSGAALIFWATRDLLPPVGDRLLAMTVFVLAMGEPIANFSYNTIATLALTALLFASLRWREPTRSNAALSGVLASLAIVSYPPLVLVCPLWVLPAALRLRGSRRGYRDFAWGALAGGLPLATALCIGGIPAVVASIRLTDASAEKMGGTAKWLKIYSFVGDRLSLSAVLIVVVIAALALQKNAARRALARPILAVVTLVFAIKFALMPAAAGFQTELLTGLSLVGLSGLTLSSTGRHWLTNLAMPSFVAGMLTGFVSGNGPANLAVGALPGMVVAVLSPLIGDDGSTGALGKVGRVLTRGALAAACVFGAVRLAHFVYRDADPTALTARIPSGPYAGLSTQPWKRDLLMEVTTAVDASVPATAPIVFMNDFPAGALLSRRSWGTCSSWVYTHPGAMDYRSFYLDCTKRMVQEEFYVVHLKVSSRGLTAKPAVTKGDPFERALRQCESRSVVTRPSFEIYAVTPTCLAGLE